MSWIRRRSELQEHDWDLLDLSPQLNEAFKISRPSEAPQSGDTCSLSPMNGPNLQTKRHFLACNDDVRQWLDSIYPWSPDTKASGINLLLAPKTDSLDDLPFSQTGFQNVINKLKVHGSIVRAINRNTSCAFIHFPFTWNPTSEAIPSITAKPVSQPKTNSYQPQEEQEPAVLLWQNISFLRIGLQNWQAQLRKMIDHADQLHDTDFGLPVAARVPNSQTRLHILQEVGGRLKTRLQDLVDEYDEYIRQCTHIMDGLTLETQLELNSIGRKDARINQEISRVNLEVAQMTRLDGSLMKSIAMLCMVFLPSTFVSIS
ncbi:hypothetical protein ACJA88_001267 [Fusarium oxysporum]